MGEGYRLDRLQANIQRLEPSGYQAQTTFRSHVNQERTLVCDDSRDPRPNCANLVDAVGYLDRPTQLHGRSLFGGNSQPIKVEIILRVPPCVGDSPKLG